MTDLRQRLRDNQTEDALVIRQAKRFDGGCNFCGVDSDGTQRGSDVLVITSTRTSGLLLRLCQRHRREIGAWR